MESGDVQVKLFQLLVDMKGVQLNHEVKKTRNWSNDLHLNENLSH